MKKNKFDYKDSTQAGSADNLIRAAAQQETKDKKKSSFARIEERKSDHVDPSKSNEMNGNSKRLKNKAD